MPEVRRVQKFGRSTLMISLPSEWVKSIGLSPGDTVGIEVLDDGSLRLAPLSILSRKLERTLTIRVSKGSSESLLIRAIYAGYILGMDKIVVHSVDGILSETHLKVVRRLTKTLIGMEVVEHTPKKVVLQVLIDPSKYSAPTIIGRMANLVRFMIQHIEASIFDKTPHLLNEVIELEDEIDRLHALTVRQLLLSQTNRTLSKYLGIKPALITEYRSIVRAFEEAADALAEIARLLSEKGSKILEKIAMHESVLKEGLNTLFLIVDRSHKSLTSLDPYLINEVLNLINEYYGHIKKYNTMIFKELGLDEAYLTILEFIDGLNAVSRAMETVVETAFDIAIEKTGKELDISRAYL